MKLIEALKNCDGCRKRRTFLKNFLSGIVLAFMWPFKSFAQTGCECLFCPDGSQPCLCCDSTCTNCHVGNSGTCILVNEYCAGEWTTYEICCQRCPPHCPNLEQRTAESKLQWWEVTFDNDAVLLVGSSNPDIDPLDKWHRGLATYKDKNKKFLKAVNARKL